MALRIFCGVTRSHLTKLVQTSPIASPIIRSFTDKHQHNHNHVRSIYRKEETKKFGLFVVSRYLEYIRNYDRVLEKRFPKAMSMYNSFTLGVKDFLKDVKEFMKIIKIINLSGSGLKALTRREMELYDQLPKDMVKIAPTLFFSMLPFAFYVVLPLIFMFPKHLLTSHFWNPQQRIDFRREMLRKRLTHHDQLFRCVQACSQRLEKHAAIRDWSLLLQQMRAGFVPDPNTIIACKTLFMERPFHIFYLKEKHKRQLLKLHDLRTGFFRSDRLTDHGLLLKAMDYAILMEGGIHNMPIDSLRKACQIRGLHTEDLTQEEMITWLRAWITISSAVDKDSLSLLLHAPLFLGYNHPNNRLLILNY